MLNPISFQSDSYVAIQWKILFEAAAIKASDAKQPMGLVNSDGLVMVTDCIYSQNRVGLCFENDSVQVLHAHLDIIPFPLTHDSGVLFFRLPFENISRAVSDLYLKFLNGIVHEVYDACKKMFVYTHEHLSHRQYDNQAISKIETVQYLFSDIYSLLESVKSFLSIKNKETMDYVITMLLDILHQLSQLSGARAVLHHNAIELLFHLKTFQRFIASSTEE